MEIENRALHNKRRLKKHPKRIKRAKEIRNLKKIKENSLLISINLVKVVQKIYKEINKKMMQILIQVK